MIASRFQVIGEWGLIGYERTKAAAVELAKFNASRTGAPVLVYDAMARSGRIRTWRYRPDGRWTPVAG